MVAPPNGQKLIATVCGAPDVQYPNAFSHSDFIGIGGGGRAPGGYAQPVLAMYMRLGLTKQSMLWCFGGLLKGANRRHLSPNPKPQTYDDPKIIRTIIRSQISARMRIGSLRFCVPVRWGICGPLSLASRRSSQVL